VLFSSGMAAISTSLLTLLRAGDHAVLQDELYGGTHAFGIEHHADLIADLNQALG
jgi:cystathionine beta-lyase